MAWTPLVLLGFARLAVGLANERPVGFLVLALLITGGAAWLTIHPYLVDSPTRRSVRVPREVYKALEPDDRGELRAATHAAFAPGTAASPDLTNLGMLSIALLGTSILFHSDPAIAAAVALPQYDVSALAPDRWWLGTGGASGVGWAGGGGGGCGGGGCGVAAGAVAVDKRTAISGPGIAWSSGTLATALTRGDLSFVEVIAERTTPNLSPALSTARALGLRTVVHGIGLSLGSVEPPGTDRLAHLAQLATAVDARGGE